MRLVATSDVVLVPEFLIDALAVFAGAGAVYSLLAFDGYETGPGRPLVVLAVIATVLVIPGSIWMAGRWGGPA
jgi:hypothetical protein